MLELTVYGPLRSATGGKHAEVEFDGGTVADALEAFVAAYPRARAQLYDDGDLRPSVRVTVDGERADPGDPCPPDAAVTLHPAVQGGRR
jgi:molybdopterin synthase sulfur carrier subunit